MQRQSTTKRVTISVVSNLIGFDIIYWVMLTNKRFGIVEQALYETTLFSNESCRFHPTDNKKYSQSNHCLFLPTGCSNVAK